MATGIIQSALEDPVKPVTMQSVANATTPTPTTGASTTQPATTTPTPTPTTASGYNPAKVADPSQWTVDGQQTVAGQVQNLISENSPLIEQARTNAKQQMNARGLVNSAMGVSAGETAAYSAALPIAQADAATYAKAAGYNTDQLNQKNLQDAQFTNAAGQFNAAAINDATLQQMANDNQKLLSSNSEAASLMNQATGVINNILMNDKMSSSKKTEASRQVYENLRLQLQILGATSSLDLSSLLMDNPYAVNQVPAATSESPVTGMTPPNPGMVWEDGRWVQH
jgi:hypothetical protein